MDANAALMQRQVLGSVLSGVGDGLSSIGGAIDSAANAATSALGTSSSPSATVTSSSSTSTTSSSSSSSLSSRTPLLPSFSNPFSIPSSTSSSSSSSSTATSSSIQVTSAPLSTEISVATSGGSTHTVFNTVQASSAAASASASDAASDTSGASQGFLQNKAASGAVFGIVGVIGLVLIFIVATFFIRRKRNRRLMNEAVSFDPTIGPDRFKDDMEQGLMNEKHSSHGSLNTTSQQSHGAGGHGGYGAGPQAPMGAGFGARPYYGNPGYGGVQQDYANPYAVQPAVRAPYQQPYSNGPLPPIPTAASPPPQATQPDEGNDVTIERTGSAPVRKYSKRVPVPLQLEQTNFDDSRSASGVGHDWFNDSRPQVASSPTYRVAN